MDPDILTCPSCPLIPEGARAKVDRIEVDTPHGLRRYKFAHDAPELARQFIGHTKICFVIVSSTDKQRINEIATLRIDRRVDHAVVQQAIKNCVGPRRRRCSALKNLTK